MAESREFSELMGKVNEASEAVALRIGEIQLNDDFLPRRVDTFKSITEDSSKIAIKVDQGIEENALQLEGMMPKLDVHIWHAQRVLLQIWLT